MQPPQSKPGVFARLASGDQAATRELLERFGPLVWSLARTMSRTQAEAEDAAQDVFVHLWKKAHLYDSRFGDEAQFVAVVTRRRLIDRFRADASRVLTSAAPLVSDAEVTQTLHGSTKASADPSDAWDARLVREQLATLLDDERTVLMLSIVRGMTHDQIACHLNKPLGTVKTTLYRGLALLRDRCASTLRPGATRAPQRAWGTAP